MSISEADLPAIIVERLAAYYPAPAIFGADEIADWPDDITAGLESSGLLKPAHRADIVVCDGCHWGCYKQVVFRPGITAARAFIICDEEPNLGRIGVPIERLRQLQCSLNQLARFLRNSFELTARAPFFDLPPLLLGRAKGRHGEQSVSLLFHDGSIVIQIGTHSKSAAEFMAFHQGKFTANRAMLRKLANRKHGASTARPRYQSDREKQRRRTSKTAQRDRAILAAAVRIREESGKRFTEIARELAALRRFHETGEGRQQPLGYKRIYRIIYEQRKS